MIDAKTLDDLARRLSEALPPGAKTLADDLEKNFRAVLQSWFNRLNLVTREEFNVQVAVLERARERIEELEREIQKLEAALGPRAQ